jgi:hypothetical protein
VPGGTVPRAPARRGAEFLVVVGDLLLDGVDDEFVELLGVEFTGQG